MPVIADRSFINFEDYKETKESSARRDLKVLYIANSYRFILQNKPQIGLYTKSAGTSFAAKVGVHWLNRRMSQ
jgi:hypothetical protein